MNDTNDNVLKPNTVLQGKFYTYTIQKVLGQGTFGITYLATTQVKITGALGEIDTIIQVAIKEFFMRDINGRTENTVTTGSQGGLYANYKKKFAREAENLSKLHHPNIVKVLEYFEANNTVYYAMEYVEGGNLNEYIEQKNGLPEAECVKYARQIGSALSYMHAHKMLHLDLKPGNVMLRKNGDAVLIDFGLSKQYDENGNPETSTTVGGGTSGYAPLEQSNYHDGNGFPVTMDVYALGATMFKMLTGVRPPEASVILNDGFPAYELQQHHVGDALTACVGKAMAALRKDRPQNIDAFLELLGEKKESTDKKRIRLHNSIDNILFSFTDSPIPGYRSFIAKFTRASATVQTFIENELITKGTIAYSPAQFEALISAINALKLYKVSSNLRRQSMGGESIRLGVENKLDVYHYGTKGNQEGTLTGDVYLLLELIEKEIPNFSGLWNLEKSTDSKITRNDTSSITNIFKSKSTWGFIFSICVLFHIYAFHQWVIGDYNSPFYPHKLQYAILIISIIPALVALQKIITRNKHFKIFSMIIILIGVIFNLAIFGFDAHYYVYRGNEIWGEDTIFERNDTLLDDHYPDNLLAIYKGGKGGLVNGLTGKIAVPYQYDYIFAEDLTIGGLISVKKSSKEGCIDRDGNIVIPIIYDNVYTSMLKRHGAGRVDKDGKSGLINDKGKIILPIIYDEVDNGVYESAVRIKKDGLYGLADINGNVIVPTIYEDSHGSLHNGLLAVKSDGKWGFIDRNNNVIIPFQYKSVSSFVFGSEASVTTFEEKIYYINKKGERVK